MTQSQPFLHPTKRFPWPGLLAPVIFLFLTLLMFDDVLFDSTKIIAGKGADLALQFLPWRAFGFGQLRDGNLALWNPHIFGGAPYFAGFQSALLYPPNWLHLFMPVGLAISWINAIHVFLAGYFTYLWCRHRNLSIGGSILAGIMFMFSGPYFPHIFAGHLPHIAIMVWAPMLFLSIDLCLENQFLRGSLLGIGVMAMLLLAGHPEYVYFTGMAAAVYVLVNLWRAKRIPLALAGCGLIVIGGTALAAVQLLSGMDAVSESVRSGGTNYEFSASFSFPPENLLTTLSPNVFGHIATRDSEQPPDTYFGRCYPWEACLFVSATGLILAIYGAFAAQRTMTRGAVILVIVCFILALGAHTPDWFPLHRWLYNGLPGFSGFRGSMKFNYLVALFLALLAGCGFDRLLLAGRTPWALLAVAGVLLISVLILAWAIGDSAQDGTGGWWAHRVRFALEAASDAQELFIDPKLLADPNFLTRSGQIASSALLDAAGVIGLTVLILIAARFKPGFAFALIGLAAIEMVCYATSTRATMDSTPAMPTGWLQAINAIPSDARVLDVTDIHSNMGMWFNYDDMWGYDPCVLKRYAELVSFSQGMDPSKAMQYVLFNRPDAKIFPLLRCAVVLRDNPQQPAITMPPPMQIAQLIPTAYVLKDRDHILSAMRSDSFDPRKSVLLETDPEIKPVWSAQPGGVKIVNQTTDTINLEADVNSPAILLVTNSFSKGWRVESTGPSSQSHYEIMPADWALQGIPLQAGTHYLRLEYRPTAFVIGKWISIAAVLGYFAALVWYTRNKWTRHQRLAAPLAERDEPFPTSEPAKQQ